VVERAEELLLFWGFRVKIILRKFWIRFRL